MEEEQICHAGDTCRSEEMPEAGTQITARKLWLLGMKDGVPIGLGYFAVAFAFGIQAKAVGMTAFQAFLLSATNLTSAGQFAGLGVIEAAASYSEMALTQLLINLRYSLMSTALSQKLERNISPLHRLGVAYGVTDEIFGVSICREGRLDPFFVYGLMTVAIPGWSLGTLCGVVAGGLLPQRIISALGIAIYGMFIAVVVPEAKKSRVILVVVLCAMVISTLFQVLPVVREISSGFRIIIVTVLVAGIAAYVRPVREEADDAA